ncbi:MAG: substrate-binding domain-containing protein [Verrucomicrobia bacterium]|nr:substrate-binding domain-containing protein [Verrucomicrobiota bacterium]
MPDLILAGSSTVRDADAASGKGLGRDLAIAFCQQEWPGGSLVNEQPKDARQDEGDHLLIYKLPTGELHRILIQPHGSRMAVAALTAADPNRRADVGMSSSPLPELDKGFSAVIIALDAVAVIVHPDNPIRELTLEQLRNIFGPNPTVTRWEDGNPIQTYGPDRKSGTTECFRAVTGIDQALEALKRAKDDAIPYSGISDGQPGREGYEDPSKVVERVSANRYAIGYVGRGVKVPASVRGVAIRPEPSAPAFSPSAATVRTMDYCMVRELFLYAATTNTRPLAARFVRFCLSDGGQKVVNDDGFIRFRTEDLLAPPVLANRAPAALRRAVTNCDRVVISVRFRKGVSDALDAVSAQNFKRLVDFLHKPEVSTRHLTLVGSADGTGTRSASALQSRQRAETLAALLTNAGVENPIDQKLGFGKDYALDDDRADPNSREAAQPNGRVDVYLRR